MSLTYTEFITKVGKQQFQKCLNNELKHFDFQYKIGLNEDMIPFNPTGSCKSGGLYFTTTKYINKFLEYGLNIAILELCEDAEFYIEPNGIKFKTNKFIIKEILPQTDILYKMAVKQNPFSLQYVKVQTPELCKIAVQQYGNILQYVTNQTNEICKIAVQQNPFSLQYVKVQTPELCKIAVKQNGLCLQYVKIQTPELCKLAVQQNGFALKYVIEKTPEIYKFAV
jgi:hypothetical protein